MVSRFDRILQSKMQPGQSLGSPSPHREAISAQPARPPGETERRPKSRDGIEGKGARIGAAFRRKGVTTAATSGAAGPGQPGSEAGGMTLGRSVSPGGLAGREALSRRLGGGGQAITGSLEVIA